MANYLFHSFLLSLFEYIYLLIKTLKSCNNIGPWKREAEDRDLETVAASALKIKQTVRQTDRGNDNLLAMMMMS